MNIRFPFNTNIPFMPLLWSPLWPGLGVPVNVSLMTQIINISCDSLRGNNYKLYGLKIFI